MMKLIRRFVIWIRHQLTGAIPYEEYIGHDGEEDWDEYVWFMDKD